LIFIISFDENNLYLGNGVLCKISFKCRKGTGEGFCGPGCKCINCLNLPSSKQGPLNFSFECEDIDDFEIFDYNVSRLQTYLMHISEK
jgi:hypothetical protein